MINQIVVIIILSVSLSWQAHAHNPARASFDIFQDNGTVRMEFAWSLRNALIQSYPFLGENLTSQEEFESCMEEYIRDHFSINVNSTPVTMNFQYGVPGNHSHSYVMIWKLEREIGVNENIEVFCDALMEVYSKQRNTITIYKANRRYECQTYNDRNTCYFSIGIA